MILHVWEQKSKTAATGGPVTAVRLRRESRRAEPARELQDLARSLGRVGIGVAALVLERRAPRVDLALGARSQEIVETGPEALRGIQRRFAGLCSFSVTPLVEDERRMPVGSRPAIMESVTLGGRRFGTSSRSTGDFGVAQHPAGAFAAQIVELVLLDRAEIERETARRTRLSRAGDERRRGRAAACAAARAGSCWSSSARRACRARRTLPGRCAPCGRTAGSRRGPRCCRRRRRPVSPRGARRA